MNVALLRKVLPPNQWSGPCVIILNANASIQAVGADAVQGGAKIYSPRSISGRLGADAASLTADGLAILIIQQQKIRMATGGEVIKQSLLVVDAEHVVAIEFADTSSLPLFGMTAPVLRTAGGQGSDQGTLTMPKVK